MDKTDKGTLFLPQLRQQKPFSDIGYVSRGGLKLAKALARLTSTLTG